MNISRLFLFSRYHNRLCFVHINYHFVYLAPFLNILKLDSIFHSL